MKRTFFSAIAASAFLLASCAGTQPEGIPAELRAIMDANREIALPPLYPDFESMIDSLFTAGFNPETAARVAEVLSQQAEDGVGTARANPTAALSHALIADEISYLFDLLRYLYVGYQLFGGDEVFLPMRDAMLERLAQTNDPLQASTYFLQILAPPLRDAIADNHFEINNTILAAPRHAAFMNEDITLRRDGGAFVAEIDGAVYRVVETTLRDGRLVDGVLPTLMREGGFAFAFGYFSRFDDFAAREMTALLENAATGERRREAVGLRLVDSPRQGATAPLGSHIAGREVGGVKIIENRSLITPQGGEPDSEPFFQYGRAARDNTVAILDLRSHVGGWPGPAVMWMYGLAGRAPYEDSAFISFALDFPAELARLHPASAPRQPGELPPGWFPFYSSLATYRRDGLPSPSWFPLDPSRERASIPNENLVIVLVDNNTSSGGDFFVGLLRQLENALFVGTNTHGNLVVGGMAPTTDTRLPHSGIRVRFGSELHLRPDLSQFEGVGFLPDAGRKPGARAALYRALRAESVGTREGAAAALACFSLRFPKHSVSF